MEKITIIEVEQRGELVEHVIIEKEDGSFVSMPKIYWDELEAAKEASGTLS